ncbi:IclR family transcriptional regulator [Humitalea sp. 24SJ18S-53]|uniref:IclR family transcriptional regulator n=1 Tax=Humitalea sp. 24SJ18S-53 TaxID=3422307 RepID=UPI003D66BC26
MDAALDHSDTPPEAAADMAPAETTAATSSIQVLDRVVRLLERLGEAGDGGEQLSRLAAGLGLSASTAHRLLAALEQHGWVEREDATRRHRLGTRLIALAGRAAEGTGLRRICRPALLRIAAETQETTFLIVRSGLNAVVVDRQEGSYVIESLTQGTGGLLPLGIGSGSLAILACQPEAEVEAILAANTARYREYGTTATAVRTSLGGIREQGYMLANGSLIQGLSVIAMPIRPTGRDVTAAIAINFITTRLEPANRQAWLTLLTQEVQSIEAGMSPPPRQNRPPKKGKT